MGAVEKHKQLKGLSSFIYKKGFFEDRSDPLRAKDFQKQKHSQHVTSGIMCSFISHDKGICGITGELGL